MNYFALLPLLSAIANVFLWTFVFARQSRTPLRQVYLVFIALCGLWGFADFIIWNHSNPAVQFYILRISSATWVPLTPLYMYFAYLLTGRALDWIVHVIGGLTLVLIFAAVFTDGIVAGVEQRYWGVAATPGILYYPAIVCCTILPGLRSIYVIGKHATQSSGIERTQLMFFLSGVGITWVLVLLVNLVLGQLLNIDDIPMLGSTLIIIQAVVVFIASTRYRFLSVGVEEVAMEIFSKSSDGVLLLNPNGRIIEINTAALNMLNMSNDNALGRRATDVLPAPYTFEDNCENQNLEFPDSIDKKKQIGLLSQCDFYLGKVQAGKLVTIRNITELKDAESARAAQVELVKKVRQNQEMKMLALGELASEIIHNVNNLMGGITGYTSLLRKKLKDNPATLPLLDGIRRAVENAVNMGDELLRFTQPGELPAKTVDLHTAVVHSISLAKASFQNYITFKTDLRATHSIVNGAETDLENVLLNLFINAKDAMDTGGTIFITSTNTTDADAGESLKADDAAPEGQTLKLTVKDTGKGIDSQIVDRIFEPFFTTRKKSGGTGLGLSNTFGIIKQMGGKISVESAPGSGATFTIMFPVADKEKKTADSTQMNR